MKFEFEDTTIVIEENELENVNCKMEAIFLGREVN